MSLQPGAPWVVVVGGPCGTGKSTVAQLLARRLGCGVLEGDDFHPPSNVEKMRSGTPLTDDDRRPWLLRLHSEACKAAAAHKGGTGAAAVVVACSALARRYRNLLRYGSGDGGDGDGSGDGAPARVFLVQLTAAEEVLTARVAGRKGHFMNATLVRSQLALLEPLGDDEPGLCVDTAAHSPEEIVELSVAALQGG